MHIRLPCIEVHGCGGAQLLLHDFPTGAEREHIGRGGWGKVAAERMAEQLVRPPDLL